MGKAVAEDRRRERLRFRSWHRGTREMDLLLGTFADAYLHDFSAEQLGLYEAVLEQTDPDLYNWVTGQEAVPAAANNDVLQLLLNHSPHKAL